MQPRRPDRVRKGLEKVLVDRQLGMQMSRLMMVPLMKVISMMTHSSLWRILKASTILDVTYPPILLPDKEVKPHVELSGGVRRTTRASSHASRASALNVQPQDADDGGNGSDGNVDPYYEARVGNIVGDVLERDLLPLEEIHGVNLGLQKKELYKDPKVCKIVLDQFPTPAETHWLRDISSVELSDRISMLQCQLITHGSMLNARYDRSLKNEVSRLKAQMGALESKCQTVDKKLSSWDKKHRNYRAERDAIAVEKAKVKEEVVKTKSHLELSERQAEQTQSNIASFFNSDLTLLIRRFLKSAEFNRAFTGVLNTTISVGVERGLRM
ncbi:hypothetical protein Tco_1473332 [Tanacetum coccineum]